MTKRIDVQLLRGLAVLLVILYHLKLPISGGYLGVDMFFVISGFVITGSIIGRETSVHRFRMTVAFLARRVRRLTPALVSMVSVTLIMSAVFLTPQAEIPTAVTTGLAAIFGVGNLAVALQSGDYFALRAESNPFLHTWSLGVEEQFYLLISILLLAGLGHRLKKGLRSVVDIWAIGLTSLTAFIFGSSGLALEGFQTILGFYSPISRAWELAVGVLIAVHVHTQHSRKRPQSSKAPGALFSLAGVLSILIVAIWPASQFGNSAISTLLVVGTTGALVLRGLDSSLLQNSLSKGLVWLGDNSYSAYLWHWPITLFSRDQFESKLVETLVVILVTGVATWISGRYLEWAFVPTFDKKRTKSKVWLHASATASGMAVLLVVLSASIQHPYANNFGGTDPRDTLDCAQPSSNHYSCSIDYGETGRLVVVGDSTAISYYEAAKRYAESSGVNFTFLAYPACPIARPNIRYPREESCSTWQEETLATLDRLSPAEIWIINRSNAYTNPETGFYGLVSGSGKLLKNPIELLEAWKQGIQYVLNHVDDSTVIVFQPSPEPPDSSRHSTLWNWIFGYPSSPLTFSRDASDDRRRIAYQAHSELSSENVFILDPFQALCDTAHCFYSISGELVFWDNSHLTPHAAELVVDSLLLNSG